LFLLGTEYFENGNKKSEGMFKDSKLDGEGNNKDEREKNNKHLKLIQLKQSCFIIYFIVRDLIRRKWIKEI